MPKLLNIHVTTTLESQISLRFALRPVMIELQTISKQLHQMTQRDLEH